MFILLTSSARWAVGALVGLQDRIEALLLELEKSREPSADDDSEIEETLWLLFAYMTSQPAARRPQLISPIGFFCISPYSASLP